ncbi:MAG: DUF58 domain-containing protein [Oscillospiraceae bacterium]|nr:DUF58 domain-containing protein [Oscillospiraceae bacterium]
MKRKTKVSIFFDRFKLVFGLSAMAAMAYLFTFYLDADIGVVVIAFLLIAPILSVLLAWLSARKITAELSSPHTLQKGKHFGAVVKLYSDSKLPVPFLRVGLEPDANFVPDDARMVQSAMTSAEPLEIPFGMTAVYPGCGKIRPAQLVVSDYLGLFRFRVKQSPEPLEVGVIPVIPSLTGAGLMLHNVSDIVLTSDDDEEETSAQFSTQSMPGYIHRDYVPGDNLKRINWKLSAKRQKLMVRMDEAVSAVRPSVILDLEPEDTEEGLKRREILMEGSLGFLMLLVRQGIACTMHFSSGGAWKELLLESEDAVRTAAVELAGADFVHDGNRFPAAAQQEKAFLIYSTRPDISLAAGLRRFQGQGYICLVIPVFPAQPEIDGADAIWQLSEDFSMTALQK